MFEGTVGETALSGCQMLTATEFTKNFGSFKDTKEPIAVTKNGRVSGVYISPEIFEHYQQLSRRKFERQPFKVKDMPESTIEALRNAQYPVGFEHLDDLMK